MMTETRTTFQTVAAEWNAAFITDHRTDGTPFVKLRDDASLPEWLRGSDVMLSVHNALDGRFPDDWVFAVAEQVADRLTEFEDADSARDEAGDIADSQTDILSHSLRAWLVDHRNASLCEEAAEELGLPEPFCLDSYIQRGQYMAIERIVGGVIDAIEEEADSRD